MKFPCVEFRHSFEEFIYEHIIEQAPGEGNCGEVTNRGEEAQDLDKWQRRRVRIFSFSPPTNSPDPVSLAGWSGSSAQTAHWKWWRLAKTKIRKLRQLGISRDEAYNHAYSRKGPWRMSGSRAVHMALSIAWLNAQGLVSLEDLWKRFAPKR